MVESYEITVFYLFIAIHLLSEKRASKCDKIKVFKAL